jgi:predicted SnoaL-like aldol condensation-catalyzing enzyme
VIGEGNMVLAISDGTTVDAEGTNVPTAFYDLYRCEAGAIAEHWEVVEIIAPRDEWRNDNGKF